MIRITRTLAIDEKDIQEAFIRSSGPGGQNVNKVATAVQLRFDLPSASYLPEDVRKRLVVLAGRRMTAEGLLVIEARRFRSQEQNRKDARDRLIRLVRQAVIKPKLRRSTRPSAASLRRRLEAKHKHGERKKLRHPVKHADE